MRLGKEIKSKIEKIREEVKWLGIEINEQKGYEEIDFNMIDSRFEDVENASENLTEDVEELLEMLEELF